ncbi:hypothetical protein Q5P01_017236 [Channa striata]|uniref:G-protein coupled receptors family 1 profile domain-containing protein n=1 Tax=Channa striata TaxID=64152 RepID=A0AA88SH32_CHASR|nr:hypothetical protein Q5P01_017236 [Channa striata]
MTRITPINPEQHQMLPESTCEAQTDNQSENGTAIIHCQIQLSGLLKALGVLESKTTLRDPPILVSVKSTTLINESLQPFDTQYITLTTQHKGFTTKCPGFCRCTNMERNASSPPNSTSPLTQIPPITVADINATIKVFSVFDGCEHQVEAVLFDLTLQCVNLVVGIPANLLVIAVLIRNRKEPSTSDIFLGCLAFMDAYFGAMTPFNLLNLYFWQSKEVWSAIKFAYGVKDTTGPLFLSCICLDRFMAVLFPILFGQHKDVKYRISLSVLVLCLTFAYSGAKVVGGLPNFEKVFTGEVLATFTWMVVCNISILWALKRSRGAGKDEMHPMKKKAFKTVGSILCIIVFNYLPPVALFPFEDYYSPDVFRCYVQPTGFAFLNISSTIQPLVYLSRLEKVPFLCDTWVKKCCVRVSAESKNNKTPPENAGA